MGPLVANLGGLNPAFRSRRTEFVSTLLLVVYFMVTGFLWEHDAYQDGKRDGLDQADPFEGTSQPDRRYQRVAELRATVASAGMPCEATMETSTSMVCRVERQGESFVYLLHVYDKPIDGHRAVIDALAKCHGALIYGDNWTMDVDGGSGEPGLSAEEVDGISAKTGGVALIRRQTCG